MSDLKDKEFVEGIVKTSVTKPEGVSIKRTGEEMGVV